MSFFEVPTPRSEPKEPEQPEWLEPPRGVVPGVSSQRPVVFKTERVFLMVQRVLVYPNAIELTFNLRLRYADDYRDDLTGQFHRPAGSRPLSDEYLRLGLQFSDGTKCTNFDWKPLRPDRTPEPPVMMIHESGGLRESGGIVGGHYVKYWVWPLPPAGPLALVAEWPAFACQRLGSTSTPQN